MDGVLPLRCCAVRFAGRTPTCRLLLRGSAADLVAEGDAEVGIEVGLEDHAGTYPMHGWLGWWAWWRWQKSPTRQKNSSTLCGSRFLGFLSRPRAWKRLRVDGQHSGGSVDAKRRHLHQQADRLLPVHDRMEVG